MDKYKRYYGVLIFIGGVIAILAILWLILYPKFETWNELKIESDNVAQKLEASRTAKSNILRK